MVNIVFDKTDKGREEIATRKHHLPPRLRTLLVLVDGKQDRGELLKKVAGIGLNDESIAHLVNNGFIQTVTPAVPVPEHIKVDVVQHESPPNSSPPSEDRNQFLAIYQFYTETIRNTLGLRGYTLQLKVEKAATIDDFRALRQPCLDAVLKSKGNEIERSLRAQLDQLLYPDTAMPVG